MSESGSPSSFDHREFLRNLSQGPGVYRMLDAGGRVLYVGKARDLRRRLASYFRPSGQSPKTRSLMARMTRIEVTLTRTEGEALLLESNLIKQHRPRYNVLLRDDKSYPFIEVATGDRFPRFAFHRGARRPGHRYFGPYPNAGAVRETLNLLQKVFRVRQCEDSFFANRSRPCLQYQIERCTAPCVGLVDEADYAEDVRDALLFLEGRSDEVIGHLVRRMEEASRALEFEQAARHRDRIAALRRVQEQQYVAGGEAEADIVVLVREGDAGCVQVFFVRGGRNLGGKAFFPEVPAEAGEGEILAEFLSRFYTHHQCPPLVLAGGEPEDAAALAALLSEHAGRKVEIRWRVRGERARWIDMARTNARAALRARQAGRAGVARRLEALGEALGLEQTPARLECFDISHTMGEATVASCVVFDQEGPARSAWRRFNIRGVTPGDDYAALRQALERRYRRLKAGEAPLPDVLLIDGGRGQLAQAEAVLEDLQVSGVTLVGVAKGPDRRPGQEQLFLSASERPFILPADSPALLLIQQIRDEAHRFAITGHRQRRARARTRSALEDIPGLGPRRRQRLLTHFGGLQGVNRAGVEDLSRVPGISRRLAQRVYDTLHRGSE